MGENTTEIKEKLKSGMKRDYSNYKLKKLSLSKSFERKGNASKIKLYIYPFGSEENMASHVALEYNGNVIDYSSHGFSSKIGKHTDCYVYEIDSQKCGIDSAKLEEAINNRKNRIKGKNYNYLTENCADQVIAVLEEAGAKDIKRTLGISIPMLNGVPSLDDWAEKHGTLIQLPSPETGKPNLTHYLKALAPKTGTPSGIKYKEDRERIRNCIQAISNPHQYRQDIKTKYEERCVNGSFLDKRAANREYSDNYALSLLPQETLAELVVKTLADYPADSRYKQIIINTCKPLLLSASHNNVLSEKTKNLLHSAGFPNKSLGIEDKPQPAKPAKPQKNLSPLNNIYHTGTQNA